MINRNAMHIALIAALALSASLASGCKKKEAAAEVATPRPSAPAAPRWSLADLDMDPRVQFPDRAKPNSEALAQAVADFASALVSGDAAAFGEMLSPDGKAVLAVLDESGDWSQSTQDLRAVRVCRIEESTGVPVVALGIEDNQDATLLAWHVEDQGGAYVFTPMAIDAPHAERVAMLDDAPLDEPIFDSGIAAEAPVVISVPEDNEEKDSKKGGRGRSPSRRQPPSGPTPLGPDG